jgi:class 3 adenylate cyclase
VRLERCFAFIDLCGFTAFTDRHPDDEVVLVLARLRTALRETAARRGVRVVKWLGDGAMLSSTITPAVVGLVVELDSRMSEALPDLPIRAGLASGPVIMFEGDDYIGRSVNLASRLCSEAQPREILASEAVAEAAPPWVVAHDHRAIQVRGVEVPTQVCSLGLAPSAPGESFVDPICGLVIPTAAAVPAPDGPSFCGEGCLEAWLEHPVLPG